MRAQGVSLLVQLRPAGLPVILHWGADLGDLDGLSAPALLAAFGRPVSIRWRPGCPRWYQKSLLPGARARPWPDPTTAAHPQRPSPSRLRLISETPVLPGLTEVGADTVIVEAEDSVNGISLDLALQLTGNGLVRCRAGISNKNVADYRLEGLELFFASQRPGHASRRVRRTGAVDSPVALGLVC